VKGGVEPECRKARACHSVDMQLLLHRSVHLYCNCGWRGEGGVGVENEEGKEESWVGCVVGREMEHKHAIDMGRRWGTNMP